MTDETLENVELSPEILASLGGDLAFLENLLQTYFACETPKERENIFLKILQLPKPIVINFLLAMLEHDEDEAMRITAAAQLARLNIPKAQDFLAEQLQEPDNLYGFEVAVNYFAEKDPVGFYERAQQMWLESDRLAEERVICLQVLYALEPVRALQDFQEFFKQQIFNVNLMPAINNYAILEAVLVILLHAPAEQLSRVELLELLTEGITRLNTAVANLAPERDAGYIEDLEDLITLLVNSLDLLYLN